MKTAERIKQIAKEWWLKREGSLTGIPTLEWLASCSWFIESDTPEEMEDQAIEEIMVCMALKSAAIRLFAEANEVTRLAGSTIEKMMGAALWVSAHETFNEVTVGPPTISSRFEFEGIVITPQFKIGEYRVDFLLTYEAVHFSRGSPAPNGRERRHLIVECDGHDFHEKTKRQASRDKTRDRFLQRAGFNVFRYSGSDIWANAMAHADECIASIQSCAPSIIASENGAAGQ